MAIVKSPLLSGFGITVQENESSYHAVYDSPVGLKQYSLAKGIHIRWQFDKILSFPVNGFNIYINNSKINKEPIKLPSSEGEFMKRVIAGIKDQKHVQELNNHFYQIQQDHIGETVVGNIMSLVTFLSNQNDDYKYLIKTLSHLQNNELRPSLAINDLLLISSIDPYIAKGLGLYYILNNEIEDENGSQNIEDKFDELPTVIQNPTIEIEGDWDTSVYPPRIVDLESTILKNQNHIKFNGCEIIAKHRKLITSRIDENEQLERCIELSGDQESEWNITLTKLVEQLSLFFEIENEDERMLLENFDWEVYTFYPSEESITGRLSAVVSKVQNQENVYRVDVHSITTNESEKLIYNKFNSVNFLKSPERLKFAFRIELFESLNKPIKKIRNKIHFYDSSAQNNTVPKTEIAKLISKEANPYFNEEGTIVKQSNDVIIRTKYYYHPENSFTPIRFLLLHSFNGHIDIINTIESGRLDPLVLNQIPPKAFLPELISYFPLSRTLENKKDGTLLSPIINSAFVDVIEGTALKLNKTTLVIQERKLKSLADAFTISFKMGLSNSFGTQKIISSEGVITFELRLSSDGIFKIIIGQEEFQISTPIFKSFDRNNRNHLLWILVQYDGKNIILRYRKILNKNGKIWKANFLNYPRFNEFFSFYGQDYRFELANPPKKTVLEDTLNFGSSQYNGVIKDISIWRDVMDFSDIQAKKPVLNSLETFQGRASLRYAFTDKIKVDNNNGENISLLKPIGSLGGDFTFCIWFKVQFITKDILEGKNEVRTIFKTTHWNVSLHLKDAHGIVGIDFVAHYNNKILFKARLQSEYNDPTYNNKWSRLTFNSSWVANKNEYKAWVNNHALNLQTEPNSYRIEEANLFSGSIENFKIPDSYFDFGSQKEDEFTHFLIWDEAFIPDEIDEKLGTVQHIHRQREKGKHFYNAIGVDLLGRVAVPSESKSIDVVPKEVRPDTPSSVFAQLKPINGIVSEVETITEEDDGIERKKYKISIQMAVEIQDIKILKNHFTTIERQLENSVYKQRFEITEVNGLSNNQIQLHCYEPLFSQLTPTEDDYIFIEIDVQQQIQWNWTGLQQVYNPTVHQFQIYEHQGGRNQIKQKIVKLVNSQIDQIPKSYIFTLKKDQHLTKENIPFIKDQFCRIDNNNYRITALDFDTTNIPKLTVEATASEMPDIKTGAYFSLTIDKDYPSYQNFNIPQNWRSGKIRKVDAQHLELIVANDSICEVLNGVPIDLKNRGISWLPDKKLAKLIVKKPLLGTNIFSSPEPDGYVMGAIVARNINEPDTPWQSFTVLWHEKIDKDLVCYLLLKQDPKSEDFRIPRLTDLTFYRGKTYVFTNTTKALPDFSTHTTIDVSFGITALDTEQLESAISTPAHLVVVDKRIPKKPEAPFVQCDGKADYYKQIKAFVQFEEPNAMVSYLIYRAAFSTIAAKDLEARRLFTGHYTDFKSNPTLAFTDDTHFEYWVSIIKERQWQDPTEKEAVFFQIQDMAELFPEKYVKQRPKTIGNDWKRASVVWQNWSERFYPALSDTDKEVIANRLGNDVAFVKINELPVKPQEHPEGYLDHIQGYFPDSFYYRLKTQTKALQTSTEMSLVSNPVKPIIPRPPRKPEISKVIPLPIGTKIFWNLNREPSLSHYEVYQADAKKDLEDLRWWEDTKDPRIIAEIQDPKIKVKEGNARFVSYNALKKIIGVYDAEDFNYKQVYNEESITAFNYYDNLNTIIDDRTDFNYTINIGPLKKVADHKSMIIIFLNTDNETEVRDTIHPFKDIKPQNGQIELPIASDIKQVQGIYLRRNLKGKLNSSSFKEATNYFITENRDNNLPSFSESDNTYQIINLHESINFQRVVISYQNSKGEKKIMTEIKEGLHYSLDFNNGTTQFICVKPILNYANNSKKNSIASASKIIECQPVYLNKPNVKYEDIEIVRKSLDNETDEVEITIQWRKNWSKIMIAKDSDNGEYTVLQNWTNLKESSMINDTVPKLVEHQYHFLVIDIAGAKQDLPTTFFI